MAYTYDERLVSDLHKDARGYRPRELFWEEWNNSSDFDRQAIWDGLLEESRAEMERERAADAAALVAFQKRIADTIALGARDEVTALKWIFEAEQFDDFDLRYGPEYVAYHFGLSYSDVRQFPVQQAINEMLAEVV